MIPQKNVAKQQRYYGWLDTPEDEREPKSEAELRSQLHIKNPATLKRWKDTRAENSLLPVREVMNKMGEMIDSTDISDDEKTALARKVYGDAMKHGASASEKDLAVRMLGMLIDKKEEIHTYVVTAEDRAEIVRLVSGILQDSKAERRGGENSLPDRPLLLPQDIREDKGQQEGGNPVWFSPPSG